MEPVFYEILFDLDGIQVVCTVYLLRMTKHWFRLDGELHFFACPKKSNQKKRHPNQFALAGLLSIRLCQRAVLTRRPGLT